MILRDVFHGWTKFHMITGHQAVPQLTVHTWGCTMNTFLLNTLLCIGNSLLTADNRMTNEQSCGLPQVQCVFHVDETGVLPELPVHVVGDPSLPMIGIDHFPGKKTKEKRKEIELLTWPHKQKQTKINKFLHKN